MGNIYKQSITWVLLVSFLLENCHNSFTGLSKQASIPHPALAKSMSPRKNKSYGGTFQLHHT
jgi:hypothetical protein